MINKEIEYGIYHVTNQGFTTWFDFAKKIIEFSNLNCRVNPISSEEFKSKAKRPKNSKLNKLKILSNDIMISDWEDGLKRFLIK